VLLRHKNWIEGGHLENMTRLQSAYFTNKNMASKKNGKNK
jgi:hypothetical protein